MARVTIRKVAVYLLFFFISTCSPAPGADTQTISYRLGSGFVGVNPYVEVGTFDDTGKKYLISQPYFSTGANNPRFSLRILDLEGENLKPIWTYQSSLRGCAFSLGDPLNRVPKQIAFAVCEESNSHIKLVDKQKQVNDLFSVPGQVVQIKVVDINHDGTSEIVVAAITKRYEELFEGYISVYRWSGSKFLKISTLRPSKIGGYRSFRFVDIDDNGHLDLVVHELTQDGDAARAFTYSDADKSFTPLNDANITNVLANVYSSNIVIVTYKGERILLAAKANIVAYSLKDSKFLGELDLAGGFLAKGDLDNDGIEEILVMSREKRKDNRKKLYLIEANQLLQKLEKQ